MNPSKPATSDASGSGVWPGEEVAARKKLVMVKADTIKYTENISG
jgi:hypothetical protein